MTPPPNPLTLTFSAAMLEALDEWIRQRVDDALAEALDIDQAAQEGTTVEAVA